VGGHEQGRRAPQGREVKGRFPAIPIRVQASAATTRSKEAALYFANRETQPMSQNTEPGACTDAIRTIKSAILRSRHRAATLTNSELLMLYFHIGGYISQNSRKGSWGTNAIVMIARQLQKELPGLRGFSATNMRYMRLFYEAWTPPINSSSLATDEFETANGPLPTRDSQLSEYKGVDEIHQLQLMNLAGGVLTGEEMRCFLAIGFTHHCEIFTKTRKTKERLFYIQKCATEFWSVDKLKYNLNASLYDKLGKIRSNFTKTISDDDLRRRALQSFKNEYLLDFINIEDPSDEPDERVLEHEIVANVRKFIMALGGAFLFVGNQYRLEVDGKEYFIDLLFFNRRLQSLVAFELKRGEFKPEYAGKLNFYLSALDEYAKLPHENPSIGVILCKSQRKTTVEFAFRDTSKPMGVATYRFSKELPVQYKNILPDAKTLKELL
jgi:predicted nuclease of restriction endonuclease-like (RecB) superfamily